MADVATGTLTDTAQIDAAELAREASCLRLGQIGYLNVFPMHRSLGVDPALTGVPTSVNAALLDGAIDVACISSIAWARNARDLVLLPSLCISSDGEVGSIHVISSGPFDRIRTLHATTASATSVELARMLLAARDVRASVEPLSCDIGDALAAPGSAVLLIGDDAMRARADASLASFHFTDLGELWRAETGLPMVYAVWAARRDAVSRTPRAAAALDALLARSVESFGASPDGVREAAAAWEMGEDAARRYFDRLGYGFGERERAGLARYLELAHASGVLDAVPTLTFIDTTPEGAVTRTATDTAADQAGADATREAPTFTRQLDLYTQAVGSRAILRERPEDAAAARAALETEVAARDVDVDEVLAKALRDERIDDTEAVALLLAGDRLLEIGQVAHQLRLRRAPADTVTFIVDRNINYTNVCVTDCGFCAFYRRPGDEAEGYLHPTQVILDKIAETIELGGTAALLQGGHNPDLDIDYYVDLFSTIRQHFPSFHLHALSPPEIIHIARRSQMGVGEVLATLRDAGLDSVPGGGGEILVDRARRVIAPKKVKTGEWLGVMREAHRMGMSTTASMMFGHAELLAERVEHMRRIRELQDETRGFRAFIGWTFQPGDTALARLLESGEAPYASSLPRKPTPVDYLLTQAVSRIYLDNVDNIQSSWVTQGLKVGQAALLFGANDLGSIMIEENVVSSAGTTYRATVEDFVRAIEATGMRAVQRDTLYRTVVEHSA